MRSDHVLLPVGLWFGAFAGENFDDVAVGELMAKRHHFAIDEEAAGARREIGVHTVGVVERVRAARQIVNIAFWRIDKNPIAEEVDAQIIAVEVLSCAKLRGGSLEMADPVQIGRQCGDRTLFVGIGEFLFVVVKACGQSALSIFVHFLGADLKFHRLASARDDRGVE